VDSAVRAGFVAGAEQLGICGDDLAGLVAVFDAGDCPATQARMAGLVAARLRAAAERGVAATERAAAVQQAQADRLEMPDAVAVSHAGTVDGLAEVARLQAAARRLAQPPRGGGCDESCPCLTAASAKAWPQMPLVRSALPLADGSVDSDLVCTLDGGLDAMRGRIGEWKAVIGRAAGREPADGGVTLVYDHDPAVAVELTRLSAAEFACCSFFSFTISVAPEGMRFTVQAPAEAATVVTAIFGAAPSPVGGVR
jgi:hypothetical protein